MTLRKRYIRLTERGERRYVPVVNTNRGWRLLKRQFTRARDAEAYSRRAEQRIRTSV